MDDEFRQNMTASGTWLRGLFMLLFVFLLMVTRIVTGAVVVIQFVFTVFSGQCNENLREFGANLAMYVYQVLLFVTYNSESKPFPFAPWPSCGVTGLVTEVVADTPLDTLETDESDKREGP